MSPPPVLLTTEAESHYLNLVVTCPEHGDRFILRLPVSYRNWLEDMASALADHHKAMHEMEPIQ